MSSTCPTRQWERGRRRCTAGRREPGASVVATVTQVGGSLTSHIEEKILQKNTNMITISAMAFLMLLPLSSSVSTAGEALKLKLDPTLTSSSDTMDSKEEKDN